MAIKKENKKRRPCPKCDGSGLEEVNGDKACTKCLGSGNK